MQPNRMGVDAIKDNPDMFQYYTGFPTYKVFLAFDSYLGPAVDSLIYSKKVLKSHEPLSVHWKQAESEHSNL